MTLEINTYGKSPAAHHLVRTLNFYNIKSLNRACTVRINNGYDNVKAIVKSVDERTMSPAVAANLLRLLRLEASSTRLPYFHDGEFISQLVRNVIIGNIKSVVRKIQIIRKIESGNVDENKLTRVGKLLEGELKYVQDYTILGYGAGTIFTKEDVNSPYRLIRQVPSFYEIQESINADLLHKKSLDRGIRQNKEWTK